MGDLEDYIEKGVYKDYDASEHKFSLRSILDELIKETILEKVPYVNYLDNKECHMILRDREEVGSYFLYDGEISADGKLLEDITIVVSKLSFPTYLYTSISLLT